MRRITHSHMYMHADTRALMQVYRRIHDPTWHIHRREHIKHTKTSSHILTKISLSRRSSSFTSIYYIHLTYFTVKRNLAPDNIILLSVLISQPCALEITFILKRNCKYTEGNIMPTEFNFNHHKKRKG